MISFIDYTMIVGVVKAGCGQMSRYPFSKTWQLCIQVKCCNGCMDRSANDETFTMLLYVGLCVLDKTVSNLFRLLCIIKHPILPEIASSL